MNEISPTLVDSLYPEGLFIITPSLTIIVDKPWGDVTTAEKALLEKILSAVGQSLNSVRIKYQASLDLSTLSEKPSRVIYFGKPVNGIPQYDVIKANEVRVISSESLLNLTSNEEARKRLWQALKRQFDI